MLLTLAKAAFPKEKEDELRSALDIFLRRFIEQQFKRNASPDGPKGRHNIALSQGGLKLPFRYELDYI